MKSRGFLDQVRERLSFLPSYDGKLWIHAVFRFVLLILGVAVIGLYAQDLNRANKEGKYSDGKWVFATVIASLSAVTALVYMIVLFLSHRNMAVHLLFLWDFVIFVLWAALFGIFGKMYIKATAPFDAGIQRMKNAVWVDCVNMIFWFISAVSGLCLYLKAKRNGGMSLHTGKGKV